MRNQYSTAIVPFEAIASTVIRRLENPPIAKRSINAAPNFAGNSTFMREIVHPLRTEKTTGETYDPRARSAKGQRIVDRKGKVKVRHAKQWLALSFEDKAEVSQAVAMVLARHELLTPGAFIAGENAIPRPVWLEIYSEARKACRIDRKYERNSLRLESLPIGDAIALLGESEDSHRYLSHDRTSIARHARFYLAAAKSARDAEEKGGNKKFRHNYRRARLFIRAAFATAAHGYGWGDFYGAEVPTDPEKAHDWRKHLRRRFQDYILKGVLADDSRDESGKRIPRILRSFSELSLDLLQS
jgi:hypothetical protein